MKAPLLLALATALLAGCVAHEAPAGVAPGVEPLAAAAAPPAREPYEFTSAILDGAYQHERLVAFPNVTIRWWNVGQEVHSVVSEQGWFGASGPIFQHEEHVATFPEPGEFAFFCRYHPEMRGVVLVL